MTTRLTLARQVPSTLGRLSTMCCSRLVPGDGQQGWGGAAAPIMSTVAPSCYVHGVTSKMLRRGSGSIPGPTGRAEHPLGSSISPRQGVLLSLLQAAAEPELFQVPGIALAPLLDEGLGIPPRSQGHC